MTITDHIPQRMRRIGNGPVRPMPDAPRIPQFLDPEPQTMEEAIGEATRLAAEGRQSAVVKTDDAGHVAVDLTDPPITAKRVASIIEHQMKDHAEDLRKTAEQAVTAFNALAHSYARACEEGARAVQLAADQTKVLMEHCQNAQADMELAARRLAEQHTAHLHGVRNTMVAVLVARDNLTQGGPLLDDDQLAAQALAQSITNLERIAPNATILKKLREIIDAPAQEEKTTSAEPAATE